MNVELQLDEVRDALSGVWDSARAQFWMRGAHTAASDGDWVTATNRLLNLTGPLDDVPSGSPAWRRLAQTALECAVRARNADLVRAVARETFDRAWPLNEEPLELRDGALRVAEQIASAEDPAGLETARALGALLRSRFPMSPICVYASAHFRELTGREGRQLSDASKLAAEFQHAAAIFASRGDEEASEHCRMRAGVLWLTATHQSDRGREALRPFRGQHADHSAQRWLAFAQAHSPFWLDRVRAADWVGDVLDRADEDSPEAEAAYAVADVLFRKLPVRVTDPEYDRLSSLLESVDEERRWALEAQLRGRLAVDEHLDTALDNLDAATAEEVQSEALPLAGLAALAAAWQGEGDTETEHPLVRAVARVLRASNDAEEQEAAGRELRARVLDTSDTELLRPVVLALLRWCERDERPDAIVTEIAVHFAARGPAPTFGFLALAAQLFAAKLNRAGAAMTVRALDEGETHDGLLQFAVARSVQWAVRDGSDGEMLEWLTRGEAFLDSPP